MTVSCFFVFGNNKQITPESCSLRGLPGLTSAIAPSTLQVQSCKNLNIKALLQDKTRCHGHKVESLLSSAPNRPTGLTFTLSRVSVVKLECLCLDNVIISIRTQKFKNLKIYPRFKGNSNINPQSKYLIQHSQIS